MLGRVVASVGSITRSPSLIFDAGFHRTRTRAMPYYKPGYAKPLEHGATAHILPKKSNHFPFVSYTCLVTKSLMLHLLQSHFFVTLLSLDSSHSSQSSLLLLASLIALKFPKECIFLSQYKCQVTLFPTVYKNLHPDRTN